MCSGSVSATDMLKRLSLLEDAVENTLRNSLVRDIYLGKQATA